MASLEEQIEATKHTLETLEEEKRKRDEESEKIKNENLKFDLQEKIIRELKNIVISLQYRVDILETKIESIDEYNRYKNLDELPKLSKENVKNSIFNLFEKNKDRLSDTTEDSVESLDNYSETTGSEVNLSESSDCNSDDMEKPVFEINEEDKEKHKLSLKKSLNKLKDYYKKKTKLNLSSVDNYEDLSNMSPPSPVSSCSPINVL